MNTYIIETNDQSNEKWIRSYYQSLENISHFSRNHYLFRIAFNGEYSMPFTSDNTWIAECWVAEKGLL